MKALPPRIHLRFVLPQPLLVLLLILAGGMAEANGLGARVLAVGQRLRQSQESVSKRWAGIQVPLKKGGEGRRPWGLSWHHRQPEDDNPCAVSAKPLSPFVKGDFVRVLTAGQGKDHATLQAAIAVAQPGDTIQVSAGVYEGQIVLDRPLDLEGTGKPVLRGPGRGSVLTVLADQCTIRGFVVEHSGKDLQAEDSGILLKSNRNVVANNELRDVLYGIYLYHSTENTLRSNVVHGRRELQAGERGAGLHLWNSADNLIEDNVIEQARDGMYIQSSPRNTIRRNRVSHLRYGLHFMSSDDNHFEDNVFSNNVAGAAIMYSKGIEFRRNAFVHNRGFSSFGILFQDCDRCLSEDNLVADNATGLFAEALRNSVFRNNLISENDVALQIYGSSSNLEFSGNHFVENLSPLQVIGKRANARWDINGQGNFWSDYDGYDLDGDKVGDRPHRIQNVFEYLEGNFPRLRIYLTSPAAQALAAAERVFPVIQSSSEVDSRPMMRAEALPAGVASLAPKPSSHAGLALASLLMLAVGILILWQAQKKPQAIARGFVWDIRDKHD